MYAILNVLKYMRPIELCFSDHESAKAFLALVDIYEDDSGSGNGYSAYWPNNAKRKVSRRFFYPFGSTKRLDDKVVEYMLRSIYVARAANFPEDMKGKFSIEHAKGAIVFSLEKLPLRVRPTVGDMYRIPRSLSPDGMGNEGKVVEDNGDTLKVIPCQYWEREGFRYDVEVLEVKASQTMKTHDWLKDLHSARTTWEFDPTTLRVK
jgi:hypothetical protein